MKCGKCGGETYVKHVLHVVDRDERVVDGDDLNLWLQTSSSENKTTDTTEAVDSYFNWCHG